VQHDHDGTDRSPSAGLDLMPHVVACDTQRHELIATYDTVLRA